jgi:hypothetical protein
LPQNNWEPACDNGAIAKVLRSAGRAVLSSDIARYDGFEPDFVADYLTAPVPHGVQAVVTNPPFKLAIEFVARRRRAITSSASFCCISRKSIARPSPGCLAIVPARPAQLNHNGFPPPNTNAERYPADDPLPSSFKLFGQSYRAAIARQATAASISLALTTTLSHAAMTLDRHQKPSSPDDQDR